MKNPAAAAAARIVDLAASQMQLKIIQKIIEEEFWQKTREEHHGPRQSDYMGRALARQRANTPWPKG